MRPTYLEVNLSQLKQNLLNIRAHVAPAKVLVVLKANAYGHGIDGVAPFIAPFADYIGVAIPEEGVHLRKLGITQPILVMGGTLPEQIPVFLQYDLTLAAASIGLLESAEQAALAARKTLKAHLKMDTGMERIGAREYEASALIEAALRCKALDVEGIFTHFANSEEMALRGVKQTYPKTSAALQLERFEEILSIYEKLSAPLPRIRHAANSGATLLLPESYYDMVRPGILFYGIYPARSIERTIEVKTAARWKSKVTFSKVTEAGRGVSYGSLWRPEESAARVLTIPCGYADGYFRVMSNQPRVVIHGKQYPQVGRICMDQFMVDAGADNIPVGAEVTLLGDGIAPEELADWAGTNEYEVMTNISARVPRVFISN
ncbi:MAG: alanine racemase [Anaerolineales bacterium]